jgi:hypothetical protein
MLTKDNYLAFRRKYEPTTVKLVVVAESPPKSGLYFYNPDGKTSEPLFAALMQQLGCRPKTKDEGLREFQQQGWVLVDATYEPVDGIKDKKKRNEVIERDYPLLVADLNQMLPPDMSVPIILVKANVFAVLERRLTADGFKVLNNGRSVPFSKYREAEGISLAVWCAPEQSTSQHFSKLVVKLEGPAPSARGPSMEST